MPLRKHKQILDAFYAKYHNRAYLGRDPVSLLYAYDRPTDREVAGLLVACLAYGRVASIVAKARLALEPLGARPAERLVETSPAQIRRAYRGFRHRFARGEHISTLLTGIRRVIRRHGSLMERFAALAATHEGEPSYARPLADLVGEIDPDSTCGHLLPDPARGSAAKRLHLYLRWMVRRDAIDPGGWDALSPRRLTIPLDVHMHRAGLAMGATRRRTADARAAEEITAAFRVIAPEDPVRYDFSLTHASIRGERPAAEDRTEER